MAAGLIGRRVIRNWDDSAAPLTGIIVSRIDEDRVEVVWGDVADLAEAAKREGRAEWIEDLMPIDHDAQGRPRSFTPKEPIDEATLAHMADAGTEFSARLALMGEQIEAASKAVRKLAGTAAEAAAKAKGD